MASAYVATSLKQSRRQRFDLWSNEVKTLDRLITSKVSMERSSGARGCSDVLTRVGRRPGKDREIAPIGETGLVRTALIW